MTDGIKYLPHVITEKHQQNDNYALQ